MVVALKIFEVGDYTRLMGEGSVI